MRFLGFWFFVVLVSWAVEWGVDIRLDFKVREIWRKFIVSINYRISDKMWVIYFVFLFSDLVFVRGEVVFIR